MSKCPCSVCQRHTAFEKQLEGLPADKAEFFREVKDAADHVEMDRNYYRALLDGSWPNADAVIVGFRARRRARPTAPLTAPAGATLDGHPAVADERGAIS